MLTIVLFSFILAFYVTPWSRLLLNLEFYGAPILLEDVLEETFLGTTCSVVQGAITVVQPADTTLIRTLQSVGRREHVLAGFSARTLTIIRLTDPCDSSNHRWRT